jgi:hypothetical protein
MMIRAVHQRDARIWPVEMFAKFQAAKTRAEHNHVNRFVLHDFNVNELLENAIE